MSLKKEDLEKILREYLDGKYDSVLLEEDTAYGESFWQRSLIQLPRLEIQGKMHSYLIPWIQIGSIEVNASRTNIKLLCDLGLFDIESTLPMNELYGFLQIERVKKIKETKEVRVSLIEQKQ